MKEQLTRAWQEYEAGKAYNRRIGLYETVRQNERFYRGEQWSGTHTDLPRPVFNLIRRVTDHLVSSIVPGDVSIHYTDDKLPFLDSNALRELVSRGIRLLDRHAVYRWKRNCMDALLQDALLDAALTGDGIFYCWWDPAQRNGQAFAGDIRTDLINNTDLFVADVNKTDLQSQEYILLAGRATVNALRAEAIACGTAEKDAIRRITSDDLTADRAGDYAAIEQDGNEKATYLIRFYRENGEVVFEKSTCQCLIKKVRTGLKYYPVAYFNWMPVKGSFHGSAPVTNLIPNQKYINASYALAMKHMQDTAFSKIIYDKSRIPEWSNEVGEAIAAMGGGNVSDAVSVVGVGKMQDGYLELIENVIKTTKEMMGATDAALGDEKANNTSAILALQNASNIGLTHIRNNLCRCIGELAAIWADMLCTYSPEDRRLLIDAENGISAEEISYRTLKQELLRATAKIDTEGKLSASATIDLLDKLLAGGHLNAAQYLRLLPTAGINDRDAILKEIETKGVRTNE